MRGCANFSLFSLIAAAMSACLLCAAEPDAPPRPETPPCCGRPTLCQKRYDQVAFLCTHNAFSAGDEGWLIPNQKFGIPRQLDDGVRALMLDFHRVDGQPYLVHGVSVLGKRRLAEGLKEITTFLDKHPREVVTIIFENYVAAADLEAAFRAADLLRLAHTQPRDKPWPTLAEMISANRRLVVFTDREGGKLPWLHTAWDYCWETPFAVANDRDFTFRKNRGDERNSLLIFNHFLTAPLASRSLAENANRADSLRARALRCLTEKQRLPNFIAVDFYDVGVCRALVEELNEK